MIMIIFIFVCILTIVAIVTSRSRLERESRRQLSQTWATISQPARAEMWQVPRLNRITGAIVFACCVAVSIFLWSTGRLPRHVPALVDEWQGHANRRAYALLLTSSEDTRYFVGTRVMIYQLLHAPTAGDIPVVVLVTEDVTHDNRARLQKDGARVVPVAKIEAAEWMNSAEARWQDLLTKLRIFELTEYDKICYLDTDILIVQNLDGVFDDEATETSHTLRGLEKVETRLPSQYAFAARTDSWNYNHSTTNLEYFNGGFLVFKPSKIMFDYYIALSKTQHVFDWGMMEQSLLNYAHRRGGSMPWNQLRREWNTDHPTEEDLKTGIKSFHDKFWEPQPLQSNFLHDLWEETVKAMEEHWREQS